MTFTPMMEPPGAPEQQSGRVRALILPPMPWQPMRDSYQSGAAPDPFALDKHLAAYGIDSMLIDPGQWPLNPLARRGTVLQSLDPLRALRVLTTERRADIVVSVFEGAALPLALLRRLAVFRVPIVLWDLGLTESWPLRERILNQVVPRVDGVFVLSASQKNYVETRWKPRNQVEILGHAIDTNFFHPVPPETGGPILAVGDDPGRDYANLMAAWAGIKASLILKTNQIPADTVAQPNVTLCRQRISHVELRSLYAACRFVVVPLHQTLNASGVSTILEAGAMGRAMVVSDNPAIRDFILPDVTCLVVPCGDVSAMRGAIERLLREPDTCVRLGENARRFVEQNCATPVFSKRLASALRHYSRQRPG
jgi:glycosyltransferase involved in cell wall biosynthesis